MGIPNLQALLAKGHPDPLPGGGGCPDALLAPAQPGVTQWDARIYDDEKVTAFFVPRQDGYGPPGTRTRVSFGYENVFPVDKQKV